MCSATENKYYVCQKKVTDNIIIILGTRPVFQGLLELLDSYITPIHLLAWMTSALAVPLPNSLVAVHMYVP